MKEINALDALHAFRDQFDTAGDAASALSVSRQYLSDMLHGRRDPSPRILAKLGIKRILVKEQKAS